MLEYKKRLAAEKLKDEDFKRDLEAARECLTEVRESKEVAWKSVEPFWPTGADDKGLWARYVEANQAYSEAKREAVGKLRAKHNLNGGWVWWLHHYLDTGENKADELQLYRVWVEEGKPGGSYIRTWIYFPLSTRMRDEIAYWMQYYEEEAFGTYYRQVEGGGRTPKRVYDDYFEQWKQSGFDSNVKKELLEEYLAPIRREFVADFKKTHGGKPLKKLIRERLRLPRDNFHQAMYRRRQGYK